MSRHFGGITQNGYVVRDIEAALRKWIDVLGVGPWLYMESVRPRDFLYKGQPAEPEMSIALGNSGDLQIELIQIRNDAPTAYKDFLDAGHEGLQHVSSWPSNYDEILARHAAAGGRVYQSGKIGHTRFSYLLTEFHTGTVFEMSDLDPRTKQVFAGIRRHAQNWDGKNPIRTSWEAFV
ncbi:MAG: VOC family protein [Candidatus Lambdaproteobacteria bacterium]|nr:VOC family protein [Candidatus Lambdaproteobacteria bacterium]